MAEAKGPSEGLCPACEDPQGHQYDDDRTASMFDWPKPWARIGDPCIWCDHSKCDGCPPPRSISFEDEHAAGREQCYYGCEVCKPIASAGSDDPR